MYVQQDGAFGNFYSALVRSLVVAFSAFLPVPRISSCRCGMRSGLPVDIMIVISAAATASSRSKQSHSPRLCFGLHRCLWGFRHIELERPLPSAPALQPRGSTAAAEGSEGADCLILDRAAIGARCVALGGLVSFLITVVKPYIAFVGGVTVSFCACPLVY